MKKSSWFFGYVFLACLVWYTNVARASQDINDAASKVPGPGAVSTESNATPNSQGDYTNDRFIFELRTRNIFCESTDSLDKTCPTPLYAAKDTQIKVLKTNPATGVDEVIVTKSPNCKEDPNCIKKDDGKIYLVKEGQILLTKYRREGAAWGFLTVPFKYHIGAGQFTSQASIGGYLGYTWNFNGYAVTPLASIGVAPLSVQTVTGNTTTTDGFFEFRVG